MVEHYAMLMKKVSVIFFLCVIIASEHLNSVYMCVCICKQCVYVCMYMYILGCVCVCVLDT